MEIADTGQLSRWKTACRLCLLEDGIKLPIFEEEGKQRQVSYKIQTCFPIVIYDTDPFPKMICHKCLFKLETVFEFRLKCLDVNNVLLRQLETCGDVDDIQKYWKAMREHSMKPVAQDEEINGKDHLILMDDKAKNFVPKKFARVRKSTPLMKQNPKVFPTNDREKKTILNETTIGARGARVTRSGNVSGDAASCFDAVNVFQEVFLDEVPADGFFPEQPIGDGILQLQDALALNVDSVTQMKVVAVEEGPPVLTAEILKKEPKPVEKNSSSLHIGSTNTAAKPTSKPLVNSATAVGPQRKPIDTTSANVRGKKKTFVCKTCKFKSSSKKELHEHLCAFQTSYSCKLCSKYFYNKALLKKHTLQNACTVFSEKCIKCNINFGSLEALAIHQVIHFQVMAFKKEEDLHSCDCGKKFACKVMLTSHRKTHILIDGKSHNVCDKGPTYNCDCGKCFYDLDQLKRHKQVHNMCKIFLQPSESKQLSGQVSNAHMTTVRKTSFGAFKCTVCSRTFTLRGALVNHTRIHNRPWNVPFVCKECPSRFYDLKRLQKHCYVSHRANVQNSSAVKLKNSTTNVDDKSCKSNLSGRKPAAFGSGKACLVQKKNCVMTAKVSKKLGILQEVENSDGIISCNICSKVLATEAELAAHQQLHSGEDNAKRPVSDFQCSTCSRSFSSKEAQLRHQKMHKVGSHKCFVCKVCDRKLLTKRAYTFHMKTHNHGCSNECGKMFKNEDALKSHVCSVAVCFGDDGNGSKCSSPPASSRSLSVDDNARVQGGKTFSNTLNLIPIPVVINKVSQPLNVDVASKKHVIYKTSSGFKCGVCGKLTVTVQGGKLHMKSHLCNNNRKVKKNFNCPFCSRGLNSLSATYKHIAANHPDATMY